MKTALPDKPVALFLAVYLLSSNKDYYFFEKYNFLTSTENDILEAIHLLNKRIEGESC